MLPGSGRRFFAVLPVVCVTDKENIPSLLTSVLYQRRVWGIDEPVLGIVFSKTGTVDRSYFGWLDLDLDLVDDQHLVHGSGQLLLCVVIISVI